MGGHDERGKLMNKCPVFRCGDPDIYRQSGPYVVMCDDPAHRHGEPPEPRKLTDQERWDWFDHGIIPARHMNAAKDRPE